MAPSKHPSGQNMPAAGELELREYQKIVQLRDSILSGKHPRIKVAASAIGRHGAVSNTTATPANGGNSAVVNGLRTENLQSFKKNARNPAVTVGGNPNIGAARNEFNPVLLQKSDDLIRAELHLRRQRLEDSLKEQLDQRKIAAKASTSLSDSPHELDIPDILAKACTLVQASAPPPVPADSPKAANVSDASDSFDDSTFYSSQHDSPRSPVSPQVPTTAAQDEDMNDASNSSQEDADAYSPTQNFVAPPLVNLPPQTRVPSGPSSSRPAPIPPPPYVPGLDPQYQQSYIPGPSYGGGFLHAPEKTRPRNEVDAQIISSEDSTGASSGDSGNNSDQPADLSRVQNSRQQVPASDLARQASPFVRGHNLSPYAPQPAHVSSLALGRVPAVPDGIHSIQPGPPAPVAALRQEHTVITSPESSPQTDKAGRRKNKKKNKRRGDGRHNDAPTSPEIKPEPRSPSPLAAPRFNHPQKRQRQAQPQQPQRELVYEDPRTERTGSRAHQGLQPAAPVQMTRDPVNWERVYEPYAHGESQPAASYVYREERPLVYHERRFEEQPTQYIQHGASPPRYAAPYGLREPQQIRSATYSTTHQPHREVSAYPRDGRMSVRPYPDRARSRSPVMISERDQTMAPPVVPPPGQPMAQTGRIVVDQYGREYIEPPRQSVSGRQSVMPTVRPREPEVVYERSSVRPPSRMLGPDLFEENGVIYRRASPAMSSRRVVTQPGYGSSEYRGYRDREYSALPMAAPQEFVQYRGAQSRAPDDFSQDHGPRTSTVRPAEPISYYSRPESTRPDIPARQYTSSVHPEARTGGVAPVVREYSVRPPEAELPRREYSVRPAERFYERPAPRDGEVMYIERPRVQEVIYTDDGRGPIYQ